MTTPPAGLPADLLRALEQVPETPLKLAISGGLDSGKSVAAAAARDTLRAVGLTVRTLPGPADGAAFVIDDADALSDAELAALTAIAADPAATVVVATQPLRHRAALRELLETLGRERAVLRLTAHPEVDPARLAARLRGLDEPLLDALAVLSLDDALGPADVAAALGVPAEVARDLVDRGHATGLLEPGAGGPARALAHEAVARAVGAVRHREIEAALLDSQLAADTLGVRLALTLAEHGIGDPRLADRLAAAADDAAPAAAARLYRAALAAGTGTPADSLRFADALALAADCPSAARVADGLLSAPDPTVRAAAVRIAASVACHDGNTAQAAELFGWLAGAPDDDADADPATGAAAAIVAIAAGELAAARAAVARPAAGPPTTEARAARNLAEGLLGTVDPGVDPGSAVARLGQSLGPAPAVAMPDDAAALVSLTALHTGDPVRVRSVLGRALREDAGRPAQTLFTHRHVLLHAWTLMSDGQLTGATAAAAMVPQAGLHARDALWSAALQTGIARRAGDTGALHRHWYAAMEVLAEYSVDLFSLLPLGELWVAAARMRQLDRLAHPLSSAFALLAGFGDPPCWSLPLHWAGVHAAILANAPEAMAPHGAALTAAAGHSDYARVLATGGRAWLRVLANQVDPDEVAGAARGLARFGLTWDATRLTGQAALQTADSRVSALMLALARDLKLAAGPAEAPPEAAADGPAPARAAAAAPRGVAAPGAPARGSASPRGAALSEREREVAELLLLGLPYRDIGAQLFISAKTVEHHVARIRRRIGAGSRTEMMSMLRAMLAPTA